MTHNRYSRRARYHKRRNNQRILILFSSLAVIIIIVLLSVLALNNNNSDQLVADDELDELMEEENDKPHEVDNHIDEQENERHDIDLEPSETEISDDNQDEATIGASTQEQEVEIEVIDYSDDDNIIRTYVADWPPIGTTQIGEHETDFANGSDDRIEIKRATARATGLEEDEINEWRVGNNGLQKVFSVITDKHTSDIYQIYLSWIDEEGWKVTKVEKLKESEWVK